MKIISNPTSEELSYAARALLLGNLVIFPTETVYGLGADASNKKAVLRVFNLKNRPMNHPLIVHLSSIEMMSHWATDIPESAYSLAKLFWPGPLTIILKKREHVGDFITGGQGTVGLRIPSHPVALRLLQQFESLGGMGISAPSANFFQSVSTTNANQVNKMFGKYMEDNDYLIDGGQSYIGIESTIIDLSTPEPAILRPGLISLNMLNVSIKTPISTRYLPGKQRASGLFTKHYSPNAKIILNKTPGVGEGLIALSEIKTPSGVIRLLSAHNLEEFAKYLYTAFIEADRLNIKTICVALPKGDGLAEAIRDRIFKASGIFVISRESN